MCSPNNQMGGKQEGHIPTLERGLETGLAAMSQIQLVPEMLGWKMSHSTLVPPPTLPCWVDSFLESTPFPQYHRVLRKKGTTLLPILPHPTLLQGDKTLIIDIWYCSEFQMF